MAMKDELRAKVQPANDLVEAVREASTVGAGAVEALLPSVSSFYTRSKDACSKSGSSDAQAFTLPFGSTQPVFEGSCGYWNVSHQQEATPFLLNLQEKDAKKRSKNADVCLSLLQKFTIVRPARKFAPTPSSSP